jgi:hypothetical protein
MDADGFRGRRTDRAASRLDGQRIADLADATRKVQGFGIAGYLGLSRKLMSATKAASTAGEQAGRGQGGGGRELGASCGRDLGPR